MKLIILIFLAGYAVKCDDSNNYYVIQMPDEDLHRMRRPMKVYWNVPTMQCQSKKVPFDNLYEKFGIIQNQNDSFRGDKIAILYDPGLFPALLKNESSGQFKFRNGGVPQEGSLEKHLISFQNVLEQSVPDPNFSGVGIIDFESWRPVFRQNFGVLLPYKDVSYEIERNTHWWWPEAWIKAEAKQRFEEAARSFMQGTISLAKQMRPSALWGYYGFPYCFNMAAGLKERCADNVPQENDNSSWLWAESTALYPSVYSSVNLTTSQLARLVAGRVSEAARVARRGTAILPYFWFRYREAGYMSQADLKAVLQTFSKNDVSGFIIWGSSNDVNTKDKCMKLLNYVEKILGPAIAKYTKEDMRQQDDMPNYIGYIGNGTSLQDHNSTTTVNPFSENNVTLTTQNPIDNEKVNSTRTVVKYEPDPELYWDPPENYTQDIVKYVEEEFNKKTGHNLSVSKKENATVLINGNNSVLIDIILKMLFKNEDSKNDSDIIGVVNTNSDKKTPVSVIDVQTTTSTYDTTTGETKSYDSETSTYLGTDSPLDHKNIKRETPTPISDYTSTTETFNIYSDIYEPRDLETSTYIGTDGDLDTNSKKAAVKEQTSTEQTSFYTDAYESTSYTTKKEDQIMTTDGENKFYIQDTFFNSNHHTTPNSNLDTTEVSIVLHDVYDTTTDKPSKDRMKEYSKDITVINTEKLTTEESRVFDEVTYSSTSTEDLEGTTRGIKVEKKVRMPKSTNEKLADSQNVTSTSATDQVASSSSQGAPKYYICIFFYFYSVSKCLCDYYGQCS